MHNNKKGIKGILMLLMCIGGPILAVTLLTLQQSGAITLADWLPSLLFLLCPLSHVFMIAFMGKSKNKHIDSNEKNNTPSCH